VLLVSVVAAAGVATGCKTLDGGRVGSATKVQRPRLTRYAWVEVVAAAVTKGRTSAMVGTPTSAPKVGKTGAGDKAVVKL
jgi:hypothetical protein